MLTTAEKVDARRYCGYGMFGQQALPANGYRFSTAYGTLEYKLNNMLPEEEAVFRTTYVANLALLETDIPGVRENLDTDQAAVWTHNKNELRDRADLFSYYRRELCKFMGIPPGPGLGDGGGIRLVV